jgi:thiol-disulfide isomerase/thioredoxin
VQPPAKVKLPGAHAEQAKTKAHEPTSSNSASTATDGEEEDGPAWLGVELATREPGQPGVLVRGVVRDSPASGGGVMAGDVIISIDGQNVLQPTDVQQLIRERTPASRVSLGLLRAGAPRIFSIQLERMPNQEQVLQKDFVGLDAPAFGALKSVQGSIAPELPALRGRVVVLEFWATWCGVCRYMIPTLNNWHGRYSAQGLTVLGVTTEPVSLASQGAFEFGMAYSIASDESGDMTKTYRALALPTLFIIDRQGRVRDVMVGYSNQRLAEIDALLKRLVAES